MTQKRTCTSPHVATMMLCGHTMLPPAKAEERLYWQWRHSRGRRKRERERHFILEIPGKKNRIAKGMILVLILDFFLRCIQCHFEDVTMTLHAATINEAISVNQVRAHQR